MMIKVGQVYRASDSLGDVVRIETIKGSVIEVSILHGGLMYTHGETKDMMDSDTINTFYELDEVSRVDSILSHYE